MGITRSEALRKGAIWEAAEEARGENEIELTLYAFRHISALAEMVIGDSESQREWARLEIERLILVGWRMR